MAELTRFRIARSAERRPLDARELVRVHGRRESPTTFAESLSKLLNEWSVEGKEGEWAATEAVGQLRGLADGLLGSKGAFDPDGRSFPEEADEGLRRLDRWLVSRQPAPTVADVQGELVEIARGMNLGLESSTTASIVEVDQGIEPSTAASTIVATKAWQAMRARLGDTLMAALLASSPPMRLRDRAQRLTRLVLVAGLVDTLADDPPARLDDAEVVSALLLRTPILPSPPFPLVKYLPTISIFARAPAFSDLYVVRDEWSCYVPGEIAHIENVLRGEYRSRLHRRVDERETTETRETDELTISEQDLQSTDRASLREESAQETELSISVEGQVDTSGRYGPTEVRTHIGASVEYSASESRKRATEQAKEVVQRALSRVERRVREVRTTRTLSRVVEANRHIIDNANHPEDHVVGIYRWVDKVQRFQTFRYPDRYLLEFQLPEPGALIRWISTRREQAVGIAPKPTPFTVDGKEDGKALIVDHIDVSNYANYAARYGVTDLPKPPAREISVSESFAIDAGARDKEVAQWKEMPFPPVGAAAKEITIPLNYEAVSATASVGAAPELAWWHDWTDYADNTGQNDGVDKRSGWHAIVATIEVAGQPALATTRGLSEGRENTVSQTPDVYRTFWLNAQFKKDDTSGTTDILLHPHPTGKVSVSAVVGGAFKSAVSVALKCQLTTSAEDSWRADVYARLAAAYAEQEDHYRRDLAFAEAPGIPIQGSSPARQQEIIHEELKRQVIEMLLGRQFDGLDLIQMPVDPSIERPRVDLAQSRRESPTVQFLEQAFEWNNMTYILYPWFWAGPSTEKWPKLQPIESADPEFDRFLRCGSARVVLPARPGREFAEAVNHFVLFGEPWGGGPAPIPEDELYVSVAQEIKDLSGAPDDGEPGESWEAKTPTTLVWLDPDSSRPKALPLQNEYRRLTPPSQSICSDAEQHGER